MSFDMSKSAIENGPFRSIAPIPGEDDEPGDLCSFCKGFGHVDGDPEGMTEIDCPACGGDKYAGGWTECGQCYGEKIEYDEDDNKIPCGRCGGKGAVPPK